MLLPWEYGVRNLWRRPTRTMLTTVALATVVVLILTVVGFIRGLQRSLAVTGDPDVALVYSVNAEENIENSAIAASTPALVAASIDGILRRYGVVHVSPELYLGTRAGIGDEQTGLGLVRGVTDTAPYVRRSVRLTEGRWPGNGEVIVGRLVAAKLGTETRALSIGNTITIEGQDWTISGTFAAGGSAFESEIWCNLPDLQAATQRQDLSLVAIRLAPNASLGDIALFCKERTDLELRAISESAYYESLQRYYQPVRMLAWLVVGLVSAAGVCAGLNMMYGAVAGRTRELASLQAIGYRRRAILLSLIQESTLLAAAASLLAGAIVAVLLRDTAVRFTMGAFNLQIDSTAMLIGCGVGLLLGVLGALPPSLRALRQPVAVSLKQV